MHWIQVGTWKHDLNPLKKILLFIRIYTAMRVPLVNFSNTNDYLSIEFWIGSHFEMWFASKDYWTEKIFVLNDSIENSADQPLCITASPYK